MSRVLIVQLSDIHFLEGDVDVSKRGALIAAAIQPQLPMSSEILIAVTGDISQSGKKEQFLVAERFLADVASEIETRHGKRPMITTVPGNHDADFDSSRAKVRTRILKQLKTETPDDIDIEAVEECVSIFDEYRAFAARVETLATVVRSPIWRTAQLITGGRKLEVHCVNNAWSCEKSTEPGSLGFPTKLHFECGVSDGALRILLMHHPAHWIAARQYRDFRRFTRECAELCFTGHEHRANSGANMDSETDTTLYIEGAALQEHGSSPLECGFNTSLIDLETARIETSAFRWSGKHYARSGEPFEQPLPIKVDVLGLKADWQEFISDIGSNVSHHAKARLELRDLYVYPELEQQGEDEENPVIVDGCDLASELARDTRSLLIKGDQGCGKTALLKRLFTDAIESGMYPVYLTGARLKSSSEREILRLIDRCIHEQYVDVHAIRVEQAPPRKRLLLLDNLDRYDFPDRYISEVLDLLAKQFGKIIATADSDFDLKEALLGDLASLRAFEQLRILEFGFKLRYQLVSRWFTVSGHANNSEHQIEHTDKLISRIVGRGLIPSFPLYVLILLQGVEGGRAGELENSALGHYYEYMILSALEPKVRQEQVHEILNYCSQFAWFLHSVKRERVSEADLRRFHGAFESRFELEIDFEARRRLLLECNLFMEVHREFGFRYPYSYYFFFGRYLSKSLTDQESIALVRHCCANLHVRENGNAMLFLAHHSSDAFVYEALKEAVDSRFPEVVPLRFERDTDALDKLVDSAPVLLFHNAAREVGREKAQQEDHQIERHFDEVSNDRVKDGAGEQYQDALKLIAEVNGLMKGIEILGTVLKANFGTIDAPTKQTLIDALFRGGLRGLRIFVEAFSNVPDYLLAELAAVLEDIDTATTEKRDRAVKVRVFHVIGRFSFWFVRRIGSSVGSKSMAPAISKYVSANDTVANQLVALASTLETPGRIPFKELQALNERVSKGAFGQSVLRWIVFMRIYMYKTAEIEKQQVCEELGIRIVDQHAIDYKTRNTKRLAGPGIK